MLLNRYFKPTFLQVCGSVFDKIISKTKIILVLYFSIPELHFKKKAQVIKIQEILAYNCNLNEFTVL